MALDFTHRLRDTTCQEGELFELSCELSKPNVPVRWMKNRQPLSPSDRIKILCERYRHVLQIMEAIPEDEGEYTLILPDNTETSATVVIKGKETTHRFLWHQRSKGMYRDHCPSSVCLPVTLCFCWRSTEIDILKLKVHINLSFLSDKTLPFIPCFKHCLINLYPMRRQPFSCI